VSSDGYNRAFVARIVRAILLTVVVLCALSSRAWALSTTDESGALLLPPLQLSGSEFAYPTLYRPSGWEAMSGTGAPVSGKVKLSVGSKGTLSFDVFSYGGSALLSGLSSRATFGFAPASADLDPWNLPTFLRRVSLDANHALDNQAQSFKVGLEGPRGKISVSFQDVGAGFPKAVAALKDVPTQEVQGLIGAAGTRTLNLEGSLNLLRNATLTSSYRSLYNDRPGDGCRGRTTADWANTLTLKLGKLSSVRFALTDHNDSATATGQPGARSRTEEVGGTLQLYPGAQVTGNWKAFTRPDGKQNEDLNLRFTGGLGHGGSTLQLTGEQASSRTPEAGQVENLRFEMRGGLGAEGQRLNLVANFQRQRADLSTGPLNELLSLHLDRPFGRRLSLTYDSEQKTSGTVAQFSTGARSVATANLSLTPQAKLRAGLSTSEGTDGSGAKLPRKQDLLVGLDWTRGSLPDWAANISRRHEFGDIYEYKAAQEASWLDLPFAGTRVWVKQRAGGPDDGVKSFLVSNRMVIAKRLHLQLTYDQRPGWEEGAQAQPLQRAYLEAGAPFTKTLVGRAWLLQEQQLGDTVSLKRTVGFGLSGKLAGKAQAELYCSRDVGQWQSQPVDRTALALLYQRQLAEDNKVAVKFGYAWGQSVTGVPIPDFRVTVSYARPF